MKRRSKCGWWQSKGTRAYTGERPPIDPSDITERIYLFKKEQDDKYMDFVFPEAAIKRTCNILIVTAGGDAGSQLGIVSPYQYAAETVTQAIKV